MTHTNPEFLYELKIGVAALQRACYEVIEACVKIDYAIRLLDKDEASTARCVPTPDKDGFFGTAVDDGTRIDPRTVMPTVADSNPSFIPAKKPPTTKGDPLAELAAQMSPQDREKLIAAMESKEKK